MFWSDKSVCRDCGRICKDDKLDTYTYFESRGEFWGAPCSEEMTEYFCPECGSDNLDDYFGDIVDGWIDEEEEDDEEG